MKSPITRKRSTRRPVKKTTPRRKKSSSRRRKQRGGDRVMPWHIKQIQRTDLKKIREKGYTLYVAPEDQDAALKIKGIKYGAKILAKKGVELPPNLEVYLTVSFPPAGGQLMTEALQRDDIYPDGTEKAIIFMADQRTPQPNALSACGWIVGPSTKAANCPMRPVLCSCTTEVFGGVSELFAARQMIEENTYKGLSDHEYISKVSITFIHEVGHILHERKAQEMFWTTGAEKKAQNASKISGYAGRNWKEFVAEVFTALVLGYKLDNDVLDEYRELQGPEVHDLRRSRWF